ncbi:cell division protein CdvB [Metallosphaera hakonensis]|uniref:Cell division protein n=1 Tax=Metallosphaera hakonensis JCM 8857 = DSM 7519 TaxID=1293036 RepID=A0A2U9IVM3_9CREN|nr:cell division protein CdvB [Metallosphaera hakonensis]AWS00013.1 cell division protein [Metallosphaera hakonensis JCM 8857 = DSM 7519]
MKLSSLFNFSPKKREDRESLSAKITEISIKLKDQQDRLDEAMRKLEERDKDLFDRVVRSQANGESARATIYAQEISDIRKIMKIVYTARLAIEKVRLKLETIHDLQGISLVLVPVSRTLENLKEQIRGVAPEVAISLDSVISNVNSITVETGTTITDRTIIPTVDEEARRILEEARKTAESKISEKMPKLDLPHPPSDVGLPHPPSEIKVVKRKMTEEELLNHIKINGGIVDVDLISTTYGVDKNEVFDLLRSMARKGLVMIEG